MAKLKILVFEYITGGGCGAAEMPDSLAREGLLMLSSLINDLSKVEDIETLIMLDVRVNTLIKLPENHCYYVEPEQDCWQVYRQLLPVCDVVWPIAPESGGILFKLCELAEQAGKTLLTSASSAVAIAGDKWLTYLHLRRHTINTIVTEQLQQFQYRQGDWIIKPVDGVGCEDSYVITTEDDFRQLSQRLEKSRYIVQPHINGRKTSLSCSFKHGKGWLICVNLQYFVLINKRYQLTGIDVNIPDQRKPYLNLITQIAATLPGLWGYVGIDLIELDDEIKVLEINPRLTSSYAGINRACGINCAKEVLALLTGKPELQREQPAMQQTVHINLKA
ncbi:MAG: ATP-grasp domain-containing protein [Gammaproteobacteria bacterium]|nr:ATP-grasp domain-containing protein [Gammaproteobacteria bacterium]